MSNERKENQKKNDLLIFQLLEDPNFRVHRNGLIETKLQINGKPGATWREAGSVDHSRGYRVIRYQGANLKAHRIVWAKFDGILHIDRVVNHKDTNKLNNAFSNLELITEGKNQAHAYKMGTKTVQRGNAKLSWTQIDEIRKDRAEGLTFRELKEKYTVSKTALSYICSGKTYKEELRDGSN